MLVLMTSILILLLSLLLFYYLFSPSVCWLFLQQHHGFWYPFTVLAIVAWYTNKPYHLLISFLRGQFISLPNKRNRGFIVLIILNTIITRKQACFLKWKSGNSDSRVSSDQRTISSIPNCQIVLSWSLKWASSEYLFDTLSQTIFLRSSYACALKSN